MYGKVFESMYDGTLASRGPWQALVTFQQMIVLADQDGNVDMTADAISRRTSIPLEIIEAGIAALLLPDPRSRTPDEDGRRIVPLEDHRDWGWRIVNHRKYQQMRKAEERREYLRKAQAESRARRKAVNTVNNASTRSTVSTPTDTDTDADTDTGASAPVRAREPTEAARVCMALKSAGIPRVNPGHPRLLALLEAGASEAEFVGFAGKAIEAAPDDPFAYLLGIVAKERKAAKELGGAVKHGALPAGPTGKIETGEAERLRAQAEEFAKRTPEQIEAARVAKEKALAAVRRVA